MVDDPSRRIRDGVRRLLSAPRDVDRWDKHIVDPGMQNASPDHLRLFAKYRREIAAAAKKAETAWRAEVAARRETGRSNEEAVREQWMTYPAGPASDPPFIAVLRRYWLACDKLNQGVSANVGVAPEIFLLKWLDESGDSDSVSVLAMMPYWPVGIDAAGNWN